MLAVALKVKLDLLNKLLILLAFIPIDGGENLLDDMVTVVVEAAEVNLSQADKFIQHLLFQLVVKVLECFLNNSTTIFINGNVQQLASELLINKLMMHLA